jgi:hypothetical protein
VFIRISLWFHFSGPVRFAMALTTTLLWIHALSGVVWTGASASFVLAGSAMAAGSDEWREFGLRVAPRLDRLNLAAGAVLLLSGLVNLAIVGAARDYNFSRAFIAVLGAKSGLFVVMVMALAASWRAEAAMLAGDAGTMNRMLKLSGLTVAAGVLALGLGLWLTGS